MRKGGGKMGLTAAFYQNALRSRGIESEVDDDGHVRFKAQGKYFLLVVTKDPTYFRLLLTNIELNGQKPDFGSMLEAANTVNRHAKLAKIAVEKAGAEFEAGAAVETFLVTPSDAMAIFDEAVEAAIAAAMKFTVKAFGLDR